MNAIRDPNDEPTLVPAGTGAPPPSTPPPDELPTFAYQGRPAGDTPPPVQREFGGYELLQEIGRGGMGVVYKARQKGLNRIVALKMILPGPFSGEDELQRFRTEAEAAARLQHPNIVAVHDVGDCDGQHYYSMDFIDGPSLSQRLAGGPLAGKVAARYLAAIARAIDYAHRHNILHRDLKPSNILLDGADQPHVTDFGLAKKLGGDSGQTHSGAVLGTPSYMAPEQAAGKTKLVGPACDIYALGAVLYELITGRPPFRSESPVDTIQQVLEEEPPAPRHLNPRVDRDLETICLKCLRKDPRERYATAAELANDLDRYLNGEPITARNLSMIDRLARTLDHSQLDLEFRSWERMLLTFAAIMFVGHAVMFVLLHWHRPHPLHTTFHWITRLAQFGLIGLTFARFRSRTLLPTSAAERQLWAIWIGYMAAYVIIVLVVRELAGAEHWDELTIYPFSAVLAGMGFFTMGSSYWGKCYLFGLAFFVLAALMPLKLEWAWAPLALGTLWAVTLVLIARHVRRLGGAVQAQG